MESRDALQLICYGIQARQCSRARSPYYSGSRGRRIRRAFDPQMRHPARRLSKFYSRNPGLRVEKAGSVRLASRLSAVRGPQVWKKMPECFFPPPFSGRVDRSDRKTSEWKHVGALPYNLIKASSTGCANPDKGIKHAARWKRIEIPQQKTQDTTIARGRLQANMMH